MTHHEALIIVRAAHPAARVLVGRNYCIIADHDGNHIGGWSVGVEAAWISAARIIVQQRRVEDDESVFGGEGEMVGSGATTADLPNLVVE